MRPQTDAERVLGRIARGEIRCGPAAAREIAERHQVAYGDAVWGAATSAGSIPAPDGCRWCGLPLSGHAWRWTGAIRWHQWEAPTDRLRQARIRARQAAGRRAA